jgi:fatty acid desaturase
MVTPNMTTQDNASFDIQNETRQSVQPKNLVQSSVPPLAQEGTTAKQPQVQADLQQADEYADLRLRVGQQGLFDKQIAYYVYKMVSTTGLLAVSLAVLVLVDSLWVQLINAGFLGFVFAQIGFIGHDSGHRQIFRSARNNEITSLVICFLLAFERSWWLDKHGRHHNNPNHLALDPDADFPVLAFTKEQAAKKRGVFKFIVKYQAFLFFPMLLLEGLGLRLAGFQYVLANKIKYPVAEPLLMVAHFAVYFGLLFFFLSAWHVVLFFAIHQALYGLFVGSVFAPNHKGMLMVGEGEEMDFLRRQVLTARNVRANPLIDFWYGGLNYQIEHHLFPNMARNKLKEAQVVTRAFCNEHAIPYYETGVFRSVKEILQSLHEESAPLRGEKAKT